MIILKNHGKTQSTIEPKPIEIDEYSVWIAENVVQIERDGMVLYEYDLTQYDKNEYIIELGNNDKIKSDAILELSNMIAEIMEGDVANG